MVATRSRRPTTKDVAAAADVSTSTVSRALSGRGYVSPDARQRIRQAVTNLGYVPDVNARKLRVGSGREIGVMVTTLRNPFYSELATAIESRLRELDYTMILATDNGREHEQFSAIDRLMAMRVAGIILTPVSAAAVRRLVRDRVRVIQVDRIVGRLRTDVVVSANEQGANEATSYLLDRGHRSVALIIDEVKWTTGSGRLRGFQQAHADRSLTVPAGLVTIASTDVSAARARVRRLLDDHPEITAIVAANGVMAEAVFRELQARGVRIPVDVSLVAYDDVPWMSMVDPPITTISQHTAAIGSACADLLVGGLEAKAEYPARTISITPSLEVRASVGRPRPEPRAW